ncbi:hypothetical protein HY468_06010 [Candidatus Roizmanbacteria bacterium]|nr:hypothetical protein [Candidatus Roizmanbacteria bacterium]
MYILQNLIVTISGGRISTVEEINRTLIIVAGVLFTISLLLVYLLINNNKPDNRYRFNPAVHEVGND